MNQRKEMFGQPPFGVVHAGAVRESGLLRLEWFQLRGLRGSMKPNFSCTGRAKARR
jgi:hypothetical protein